MQRQHGNEVRVLIDRLLASKGRIDINLDHRQHKAVIDRRAFSIGTVKRTLAVMKIEGYQVRTSPISKLLGLGTRERITVKRN